MNPEIKDSYYNTSKVTYSEREGTNLNNEVTNNKMKLWIKRHHLQKFISYIKKFIRDDTYKIKSTRSRMVYVK